MKIYHFPRVGLSFSPGGDGQPEITGGPGSGRQAGREVRPGSDLNFNTFPTTAVWAGKMTRGKQAVCFSYFSGHPFSSPHRTPQAWFILSPNLQDLDEPRHDRQGRKPSPVRWDVRALGLGISIIRILLCGAQCAPLGIMGSFKKAPLLINVQRS